MNKSYIKLTNSISVSCLGNNLIREIYAVEEKILAFFCTSIDSASHDFLCT